MHTGGIQQTPVMLRLDGPTYWIARVLLPGSFIILIHYICFSDGPAFRRYPDSEFVNRFHPLPNFVIPTVVSEISQVGKAPIDADAETAKKVVRLMEALDDHDDVQNVYSDLNMSEELMAEVAKE